MLNIQELNLTMKRNQTDVHFLLYVTIKTKLKCRFYVTRRTSSKRHSPTFIYYSHSKTKEPFLNFHFFYSKNSTNVSFIYLYIVFAEHYQMRRSSTFIYTKKKVKHPHVFLNNK